jgi:hypothetical protein
VGGCALEAPVRAMSQDESANAQRDDRALHRGVIFPAFWGTVESLSRLTNASSALASAVHA